MLGNMAICDGNGIGILCEGNIKNGVQVIIPVQYRVHRYEPYLESTIS